MTYWREESSSFGVGVMPSGAYVHDGYSIERDNESECKWKFTYEVDGKKVTHTFDMAARWVKRFGPHPGDELWEKP